MFIDHDAEAVRLIGENLRLCGAHDRARVLRRPILPSLDTLAKEQPDLGRFDLVFLGMGPDGHTASLFPGTAALHSRDHEVVVANYVEKFKSNRITLTASTINNARNVTFLVAGADKADALREVLEGKFDPEVYPSQLIRPKKNRSASR